MNKKVIALVGAIMLLVLALMPTFALANLAHGYVKTANYGPVNMRADISRDSEKVGSIPYGTRVVILEYLADNSWMSVDYDGKTGYIMSRYITMDEPPAKPENPGSQEHPHHTSEPEPAVNEMFRGFQDENYTAVLHASAPGGFVHMRWAPSKQMDIMTDFYDGKHLQVIAQNRTWCQVQDPDTGKTGFMMRYFLTAIQ